MQQQEIHPWKWFAPKNSKTLIVGTFPPAKRNWSYDFFYPNKANFFWRVMAEIADAPLQYFTGEMAVTERKQILSNINTAITDMGHTILRNDNSSLDEKLDLLEFMDIFHILDENPGINKIIFTSSSGIVSASKWFNAFLKTRDLLHTFPKGNKPIRSKISYAGRSIHLVVLYSTSPRAANRISFQDLTALYRNEILSV